jgi:hypothetical protein
MLLRVKGRLATVTGLVDEYSGTPIELGVVHDD